MLSLMLKLAPAFIGATVHALSFSAALLANPVTWVIAGIVGLGVALVTVAKKWDFIKEKAQQFFNFILEKTSPILNIFKKIGGWFGFGKKLRPSRKSIRNRKASLKTKRLCEPRHPSKCRGRLNRNSRKQPSNRRCRTSQTSRPLISL